MRAFFGGIVKETKRKHTCFWGVTLKKNTPPYMFIFLVSCIQGICHYYKDVHFSRQGQIEEWAYNLLHGFGLLGFIQLLLSRTKQPVEGTGSRKAGREVVDDGL